MARRTTKPLTLTEAIEALSAAIIFSVTRERWGADPPAEAYDRAARDARELIRALKRQQQTKGADSEQ